MRCYGALKSLFRARPENVLAVPELERRCLFALGGLMVQHGVRDHLLNLSLGFTQLLLRPFVTEPRTHLLSNQQVGMSVQPLAVLEIQSVDTNKFNGTGLKRLPHRVRVMVLCPELRRSVGGLRDFEAPIEEVVWLGLKPKRVLVVENHACGTALRDMPGCVAFAGLGKAVGVLGRVPWAKGVPALYWGDIDTHGLVILNSARAALPGLQSVLMDVATMLEFKELAVHEAVQAVESGLEHLAAEEAELFEGLKSGRWGLKPRVEQERLPWTAVEAAILAAWLVDE